MKSISELISLTEKRALITGSATGIGCAIAYRFVEAGAALELVDINDEGLKVVKEELSQFDLEINLHNVDLSKKEDIDSLWEKLTRKELDILVNNAGVYPFQDFLEGDEPFLEKILGINLNSVCWMCQNFIKRQLKTGGVIINVGSIEAILPFEKDLTIIL
ncbi:MAG: SDR family NAD(P)-dependent oxidoreductase [Candidatus Heimdallarchaeota archaeon]